MAAYRRVYDLRHLQADCQEPGSARLSSMGYLYSTFILLVYRICGVCVELRGEYLYCYSNKTLSVWFKKVSAWQLTYQQSVSKRYHTQTVFTVLPTRWRQKPAGIGEKRDYVTVTLCIRFWSVIGIYIYTVSQRERPQCIF